MKRFNGKLLVDKVSSGRSSFLYLGTVSSVLAIAAFTGCSNDTAGSLPSGTPSRTPVPVQTQRLPDTLTPAYNRLSPTPESPVSVPAGQLSTLEAVVSTSTSTLTPTSVPTSSPTAIPTSTFTPTAVVPTSTLTPTSVPTVVPTPLPAYFGIEGSLSYEEISLDLENEGGAFLQINVPVVNKGSYGSGVVGVYENGVLLGETIVELDANVSGEVQFEDIKLSYGSHELEVRTGSGDSHYLSVDVARPADVHFVQGKGSEPVETYFNSVDLSSEWTIPRFIKNSGERPAVFDIAVMQGDVVLDYVPGFSLAAGDEKEISFNVPLPSTGDHNLEIALDPDYSLLELKDARLDNIEQLTINVPEAAKPYIERDSVIYDVVLKELDSITYDFTIPVSNDGGRVSEDLNVRIKSLEGRVLGEFSGLAVSLNEDEVVSVNASLPRGTEAVNLELVSGEGVVESYDYSVIVPFAPKFSLDASYNQEWDKGSYTSTLTFEVGVENADVKGFELDISGLEGLVKYDGVVVDGKVYVSQDLQPGETKTVVLSGDFAPGDYSVTATVSGDESSEVSKAGSVVYGFAVDAPVVTTRRAWEYCEEICFESEFGSRKSGITKYGGLISVYVGGDPFDSEVELLHQIAAELREYGYDIRFVDDIREANQVTNIGVSREEVYKKYNQRHQDIFDTSLAVSISINYPDGFRIGKSRVYVFAHEPGDPNSKYTVEQRHHGVVEDVTQSITGILNDSLNPAFRNSIFNEDPNNRLAAYTALDIKLFGLHGSDTIKPGMSREEVFDRLVLPD